MEWLKKNLKWIVLILFFLLVVKSIQSCNRNMLLRVHQKDCDSIQIQKNLFIDSLQQEIVTRDFMIKDLANELKIAGVKVNEAQKRADAVQRTAERVKTNTTIEIKGAERDTTNNLE
jgi:hypothetical protein